MTALVPTLQHGDHVAHLRRESDRFLEVLCECDPEAAVPSCPSWSADDLLWHLGEVQWFWATVVAKRLQEVVGLAGPERPADHDGLVGFLVVQSERLHTALLEADPREAVYMWAPDRTVGYVARRQAHEALIHRLDAELTAGDVTPLDPTLASDGVAEALGVMYGGCPDWASFTPAPQHLRVVASDTGLTLPVVLGRITGTDPSTGTAYDEDDISVTAAAPEAAPAATLTGRAEDLDAWLWHRRDLSSLSVAGDADVFGRFASVLSRPIE